MNDKEKKTLEEIANALAVEIRKGRARNEETALMATNILADIRDLLNQTNETEEARRIGYKEGLTFSLRKVWDAGLCEFTKKIQDELLLELEKGDLNDTLRKMKKERTG